MRIFLDLSENSPAIEAVFRLANLYVMPFWILMILAPKWKVTHRAVRGFWFLIPLAFFYSLFVIPALPNLLPILMNPKLDVLQEVLASPEGTGLSWLHFLAFDLFVGRAIFWQARKNDWNVFLSGFLLFSILMVGPFGWLLAYTAGRLLPEKVPVSES
jgi:hypothetical protein